MIRVPQPTDMPDTFRRYPRTLEEAFGPYQRQGAILERETPPRPLSHLLRWLYVSAIAVILACFFILIP